MQIIFDGPNILGLEHNKFVRPFNILARALYAKCSERWALSFD